MARRLGLVAGVLALLLMVWGGCIVRTPGHHPRHRHYRSKPHKVKHKRHKRHKRHKHKVRARQNCPSSHYWDGARCRHRGKGHGARKHDY